LLKLVIIAGGKGTRLKKVFKKSKILVKVFNGTMLDHILNNFQDIKKKYIIINQSQTDVLDYIKKKNYKLKILIEKNPLGDGGALFNLKQIKNYKKSDFLVVYCDILTSFDYKKFYSFYKNKNKKISLVCHTNKHLYDSDIVDYNFKYNVNKFYFKPHIQKNITGSLALSGIYLINGYLISTIKKKKQSFKKILQKNKMQVSIYKTREFITDVGTPKRINQVKKNMSLKTIKKFHIKNKLPAIFLDRDGVINREHENKKFQNPLDFFPKTLNALKSIDAKKFAIFIITNQSAIAKGFLTENKLKKMHYDLLSFLGTKEILIQDIYYCPHHPHKGFKNEIKKFKIYCKCRKPEIGMFKLAIKEYNIDKKKSYYVGNSIVDYQAAKKLGIEYFHVFNVKKNNYINSERQFSDLKKIIDILNMHNFRFKMVN
jgi:mannose-1-phosphate guanylyltransferase/phosphomannomutase